MLELVLLLVHVRKLVLLHGMLKALVVLRCFDKDDGSGWLCHDSIAFTLPRTRHLSNQRLLTRDARRPNRESIVLPWFIMLDGYMRTAPSRIGMLVVVVVLRVERTRGSAVGRSAEC